MPKLYHHERFIDREFENLYTGRRAISKAGEPGPPGPDGPDGDPGADGLDGSTKQFSKLITNISRWWQDPDFRAKCAVPGEWRDIFQGEPFWWDANQPYSYWQQHYLDRFAVVPASNYGLRNVPIGWRYDSHYAIGELPGDIIVTGIWLHLIEYGEIFDNRTFPFGTWPALYSKEFFIYLRDKGTAGVPGGGGPEYKAFNPVAWSGELRHVAENNEGDDALWTGFRYPRGKCLNMRPRIGNTMPSSDVQALQTTREHRHTASAQRYHDQQYSDIYTAVHGFPPSSGTEEGIFGRRESYVGPNGAWVYLDVLNELFRYHYGWLNLGDHLDPARWPLGGGNILLTITYEEF